MGKEILVNSITDPNIQQPWTGPSLKFLQDWNKEALLQTLICIITDGHYNSSNVYVLNGLINTGSGANYIISAGYVLVNGEIYYVPAFTGTTSGANVVQGQELSAYDLTIDPVTFTDLIARNVHNVRTMPLSIAAVGGATVFEYTNLIFIKDLRKDKFLFAYAQSGTTETGTSDNTIFKYATEAFDAEGWHNTSNGRITPDEAGNYEIDATALITIAAALSTFAVQMTFYKNGSSVGVMDTAFPYPGSNNLAQLNGKWVASANGSSDYFEVRMGLSTSQSWSMTGTLFVRKLTS